MVKLNSAPAKAVAEPKPVAAPAAKPPVRQGSVGQTVKAKLVVKAKPVPAPGHRTAVCNWCLKEKDIPLASKDSQCSECAEAFPVEEDEDEDLDQEVTRNVPLERRLKKGLLSDRSWRAYALAFSVACAIQLVYVFSAATIAPNGKVRVTECVEEGEEYESGGAGTRPDTVQRDCVRFATRSVPMAIYFQSQLRVTLGFGILAAFLYVKFYGDIKDDEIRRYLTNYEYVPADEWTEPKPWV